MLWYAIKDLVEYHSVMVAEIRQPQLFTPKPFTQSICICGVWPIFLVAPVACFYLLFEDLAGIFCLNLFTFDREFYSFIVVLLSSDSYICTCSVDCVTFYSSTNRDNRSCAFIGCWNTAYMAPCFLVFVSAYKFGLMVLVQT